LKHLPRVWHPNGSRDSSVGEVAWMDGSCFLAAESHFLSL